MDYCFKNIKLKINTTKFNRGTPSTLPVLLAPDPAGERVTILLINNYKGSYRSLIAAFSDRTFAGTEI